MAYHQWLSRQQLHLSATILLLLALTLLLQLSPLLLRLEHLSYDIRMRSTQHESRAPDELVAIMIDEASLQAMNPILGNFPWPRAIYADLIDYLVAGGAQAILFDLLFTENQHPNPDQSLSLDDQRLTESTRSSGITYHSLQFIQENGVQAVDQHTINRPLPQSLIERYALKKSLGSPKSRPNDRLYPFIQLAESARGLGSVAFDPDEDGIYRRLHLLSNYQNHLFPALALAPLVQPDTPLIQERQQLIIDGHLTVPLDVQGTMLIKQYAQIRAYSISGVLASIQKLKEGEVEAVKIPPDQFAGKIVLIGASAIGLDDLKATPLSPKTPGVLLHLSALGNLLHGDLLQESPLWFTDLVALGLIVVILLTILKPQPMIHRFGLALLAPLLYNGALFLAFSFNWVLNFSIPFIATLLSFLGGFTYLALTEMREKQRVRTTFSRYVSPEALNQILSDHHLRHDIALSNREELTIFFSDIRSFTSIAEHLPAQRVVELLNSYFGIMAEIAYAHKGTLDKYIGDAIMAFWGAPIRIADHAHQALLAALEMDRRLVEVNALLQSKQLPTIDIGIGLHTGEAILGNIGSEHKLDYTVIGDSVNLASRLEGLTKRYGCRILISDATYLALTEAVPCAILDLVRVKGKDLPIVLFAPLASLHAPDDLLETAWKVVDHSHHCFRLYLEQSWLEAIAAFETLPLPTYRELMQARCRAFMEHPPTADWDGIATLTEK